MDSVAFREALGQFATGVCVVTVNDADLGPLAMTVNSFSSVSLDPALVLWSIQNASDHFSVYTECEHFGISVLSANQADISAHYAKRGEHQALTEHFGTGPSGEPQLLNALAHFSCLTHAVHPGGDHHIIVGEVQGFESAEEKPLIFFAGGYRGVS
ncbi:MAG: flavin reductase family protein [Luminiphilus sp.]|nr:flavin reductase family protein [Luminiphilus sp.]